MTADRLFPLAPTAGDRSARRRAARSAQGALPLGVWLDEPAAPYCAACGGAHLAADCPHGEALELDPDGLELVVVVPCSAGKVDTGADPIPAGELYTGSFHRFARHHAERLGARVVILSAWYGLIDVDHPVRTYEMSIDDPAARARPNIVRMQAMALGLDAALVVSFCPKRYAEVLHAAGLDVVDPLAGSRGIGDQRHRIARLERAEVLA